MDRFTQILPLLPLLESLMAVKLVNNDSCFVQFVMIFLCKHVIFVELIQLTIMHGNFQGIVGQDPSDSKFNWLHVDIFQFRFIHLRYYSIYSFKMIGHSPKVQNFNWLFLKLNRFICNQLPVLPGQWSRPYDGNQERSGRLSFLRRLYLSDGYVQFESLFNHINV